ncbi:chloride channel protein [Tatumella saanichensis]|uniref:chloride channel protein n=1 Tax=Tatumella saanichensis TaxID=480813 RepID=UPI0004A2AC42|nr:chloride channel protein [Tatumella saanichensis]
MNKISFPIAVIITGIVSGVGGMLLAMLLHTVQHWTFGYSLDAIISPESFLSGVTHASGLRRFAALVCGGLVAGVGWWLLGRYGKKRVSVDSAVKNPDKPMPAGTTFIHALLQIITVGMGSPLGREVAPREVGALGATGLASLLKVSSEQRRVLIACGAGAGLAAVYNVPLAGAIFTLEVLLVSFQWSCILPAILTSAIAAVIASLGLGSGSQYHFPTVHFSHSLFLWVVLTSPLFGVAASYFRRFTNKAKQGVKQNWQMPVLCLMSFALTGLLAVWFPQLPGNGKGPTQLALQGTLDGSLSLALLVCKVVVIICVLRAGAEGGVLTPGLTVGALMANGLFSLFSPLLSVSAKPEIVLIGAAAFLGTSMCMPLTAIFLALEFTRADSSLVVPLVIGVVIAYSSSLLLEKSKA